MCVCVQVMVPVCVCAHGDGVWVQVSWCVGVYVLVCLRLCLTVYTYALINTIRMSLLYDIKWQMTHMQCSPTNYI